MAKLSLKVLWLESSIAFAIDQSLEGKIIPLTEFYFWPITDSWDLIKCDLERLNWVSQVEAISILNTITEIINFWQARSDFSFSNSVDLKKTFPNVLFIGVL